MCRIREHHGLTYIIQMLFGRKHALRSTSSCKTPRRPKPFANVTCKPRSGILWCSTRQTDVGYFVPSLTSSAAFLVIANGGSSLFGWVLCLVLSCLVNDTALCDAVIVAFPQYVSVWRQSKNALDSLTSINVSRSPFPKSKNTLTVSSRSCRHRSWSRY